VVEQFTYKHKYDGLIPAALATGKQNSKKYSQNAINNKNNNTVACAISM
jgi:hypothetical protein